ncbi:hypothetical protein GCM10010417_47990 [Streptomyces carpaticus]
MCRVPRAADLRLPHLHTERMKATNPEPRQGTPIPPGPSRSRGTGTCGDPRAPHRIPWNGLEEDTVTDQRSGKQDLARIALRNAVLGARRSRPRPPPGVPRRSTGR